MVADRPERAGVPGSPGASEPELPERARLRLERRGARAPVSARLLASWQRSQDYGVSLDAIEPVFAGTVDEDSLFVACGREVLVGLHRTLSNEPVSLMLTDAEGLVLDRLSGDHSLLRALDAVHLAPGFSYAEHEAGTNGVGLALADRLPTLVRADEHYALSLTAYTCAAAPVLDPVTGRLAGSVNLTTWSESSSELLVALAQSAAGNVAALMQARSRGERWSSSSRPEVFRVQTPRLASGLEAPATVSPEWDGALAVTVEALLAGRIVAAVGEAGSGRTTLLAQAERLVRPRGRIIAARPPAPHDMETWFALWAPELGKPHTAVIARQVDRLPTWAAERLRDLVTEVRVGRGPGSGSADALPFAVTAENFEDIPAPLARAVEAIVEVPPLRARRSDILPLASYAARTVRGRTVQIAPNAARVLVDHDWPGNVEQLERVIREAARRTDLIDVQHLPAEIRSGGSRRLTRIEGFERDEIVRVTSKPGISMTEAASQLGMGRATLYRKIAQYGITIPRSGRRPPSAG